MCVYRFSLFLFISIFCISSDIKCSDHRKELKKQVESNKSVALQKFLEQALDTTHTLQEIEAIAREHNNQPVIDAAVATRKVFSRYRDLGIPQNNFFKTALFITSGKLASFTKKHRYLTPSLTGLDDTIEYDPKTKKVFILLERYDDAFLGKGNKKSVYKSILFHRTNPKILARAEQSVPMITEKRMYQKMQHASGVVKARAFTSHTRDGIKYNTMYFDLFNPGAFNKVFFSENQFSLKEIATIVKDVLTGVESFHRRGLVHRDLHSRNFLIDIHKGKKVHKRIDTVIADFGRTISIKNAKGVPVQGGRYFRAPEGINPARMKGKDYFASDIYAIGCVFYELFYHKKPSWQRAYLKSFTITDAEKKRELIMSLKEATDTRRKLLEKKSHLDPKRQLELLILKMVQVNPKKRGTAKKLRQKAESICVKLASKKVPN